MCAIFLADFGTFATGDLAIALLGLAIPIATLKPSLLAMSSALLIIFRRASLVHDPFSCLHVFRGASSFLHAFFHASSSRALSSLPFQISLWNAGFFLHSINSVFPRACQRFNRLF